VYTSNIISLIIYLILLTAVNSNTVMLQFVLHDSNYLNVYLSNNNLLLSFLLTRML